MAGRLRYGEGRCGGVHHKRGWDGWAVEMIRAGCAEPALVGPWTMGRNKVDPELLDATADQTCHPAKIALSDWPLTARESRIVPRREWRRLLKAELGVFSGNRMTLIPQGLCPALDACTQSSLCSSLYRHVIDAADRCAGQDVAVQGHTEDAAFVAIRCRLCHGSFLVPQDNACLQRLDLC